MKNISTDLKSIIYDNHSLQILNQLLLPNELIYEDSSSCFLAYKAIKAMKVRGAPLIAITACLALACEIQNKNFESKDHFFTYIKEQVSYLSGSRPTAVNLSKALNEIYLFTENLLNKNIHLEELKQSVLNKCESFHLEDENINKLIGKYGATIFRTNAIILTHCNTGSLATAGFGTALGIIRQLKSENKLEKVYCTETRPYLQGSRLTAFELNFEKIPFSLITDSMSAFLMKTKNISAVIVGADRVALNGDTANKIGTYSLAVCAHYHKIPFYVALPISSLDLNTASGHEIIIEERPSIELTEIGKTSIAPKNISVWNPSFDITPGELISGFITEKGVILKSSTGDQYNLKRQIYS